MSTLLSELCNCPSNSIQIPRTPRPLLLLTCHAPDVRPSLFRAVNSCGLAFDGRLVVDPVTMQTSDKAIYAAGDLTKFSRRHDRVAHYHAFHSPRDLGSYLAQAVTKSLDPTTFVPPKQTPAPPQAAVPLPGGDLTTPGGTASTTTGGAGGVGKGGRGVGGQLGDERGFAELPSFSAARTVSCRLPGGLVHVRSCLAAAADPKVSIAPAAAAGDPQLSAGNELVVTRSGEAGAKLLGSGSLRRGETCSVKLDKHGRLAEFSYLGPGPVEPRNLGRLVGLHAALALGLPRKHREGKIPDLVAFFREPWAQALFHDRFADLVSWGESLLFPFPPHP